MKLRRMEKIKIPSMQEISRERSRLPVSESVSGGSAEHDLFACSCCGCCSSSCDAVFSGSSGFGNQYGTDTFRPGYSVAGEKRSL